MPKKKRAPYPGGHEAPAHVVQKNNRDADAAGARSVAIYFATTVTFTVAVTS